MTDTMSKSEIVKRLWEARMMHRYGRYYLASLAPQNDRFPMVMVGNPEQKVIISDG